MPKQANMSLPEKEEIEKRLNALLQQFAQTAIDSLDSYTKKATKDNYSFAKLSINNLPESPIKTGNKGENQ